MKKILIVDDQVEIRRLMEITLRAGDYEILQAQNAQEAIEIAKNNKPDLIIMDIMMPGNMDGLDATRILKSDPETKDSIIIMLTAKGQESEREKGLEAGAYGYFVKPFSPLELIKKIEEALG
jgi:CheY-like chemotaxis protein